MWRVVCIGLRRGGYPHRPIDRGPLQADERRARAIADWLRATGLYASVQVERTGGVRSPGEGGASTPPAGRRRD